MEIEKGSVIRLVNGFSHIEPPNMNFKYMVPRTKMALCIVVDVKDKDDFSNPDIEEVMNELGWYRKDNEKTLE